MNAMKKNKGFSIAVSRTMTVLAWNLSAMPTEAII
jgi:hypothetical protein